MSNRNLFADVSSNNSGFNAGQYASAGYGAVAIKASEGTGFVNPDYEVWTRDAHRHNLAVIHYHFARPENGNPRGEVDHFLRTIEPHFRRPGDYLCFDIETGDPHHAASWLREADALAVSKGYKPWCYCGLSYYEAGQLQNHSKEFWIAAWGSVRPGNFRWRLDRGNTLVAWQRNDGMIGSGPTRFAGIPGTVDSDILNPSVAKYLNRVRRAR